MRPHITRAYFRSVVNRTKEGRRGGRVEHDRSGPIAALQGNLSPIPKKKKEPVSGGGVKEWGGESQGH